MIEASKVGKRYAGGVVALRDVSFSIGRGEIVGVLGPNGAGKTTLLRILTGYFEPSEGKVTVGGIDVVERRQEAQAQIGYLPEHAPSYPEMLVQDYLLMMARLRGMAPAGAPASLAHAIEATGLGDHLTRPIGTLSKGFCQRVGLAQALLDDPQVLILDEPTTGLDPNQVVHVRELIRSLAERTTILFSTHILHEVELLCDRAMILLGGQLKADARLEDLRGTDRAVIAVAAAGGPPTPSAAQVDAALSKLGAVTDLKPADPRPGYHTFAVEGRKGVDLGRELFRLATREGWELGELRPITPTLESVFRELVRDHERGATPTHEVTP